MSTAAPPKFDYSMLNVTLYLVTFLFLEERSTTHFACFGLDKGDRPISWN